MLISVKNQLGDIVPIITDYNSQKPQREDSTAAQRAAVTGSWTEAAPLHKSVVLQQVKLAV